MAQRAETADNNVIVASRRRVSGGSRPSVAVPEIHGN